MDLQLYHIQYVVPAVYIALGTHYGSIDPNADAGIGIYNFNTTSCTIVNGSHNIRNISCLFICR